MEPEKPQLLELNLISAQNLKKLRRMQTYALAWVDPRTKLRTRIDTAGLENPTWNDKFIFTVPNWFISRENSAVEIEIYASGRIMDTLVGTVRVLIGNLIDSGGATCTPLQVRRPSGRFQGFLNLGLMVLDGPLKCLGGGTSNAMGYRDLMGEKMGRRFFEKSALKVRNEVGNGGQEGAVIGRSSEDSGEKVVIGGKENPSDVIDDGLELGSCGSFVLGSSNGMLCWMMFQKKNIAGGVPKIHLSPSDQNLQISPKKDGSL